MNRKGTIRRALIDALELAAMIALFVIAAHGLEIWGMQ